MMCYTVQRRLTTLIRIIVAVAFTLFIMCKYYYAVLHIGDRIVDCALSVYLSYSC